MADSKRRTGSRVDEIYGRLRQMAMTYQFRPGVPLNEVELAASLGVSRTPLREVLNRLVAEGLLDFVPRRGFSGQPLNLKAIADLYEMRCGLEMIGAKLATERATEAELEALTAFWDKASLNFASLPAVECVRCDEEFHEQIATLSGNGELFKALQNLNARVHYLRLVSLEKQSFRDNTCYEHQLILAAIRARDAEGVANRMYAHVSMRQEQLTEVIKEGIARLYLQ